MRLSLVLLSLLPALAIAQSSGNNDDNAQVTTISSEIESNGQKSTQVITSTITSAPSQSSGNNDDNNNSNSGDNNSGSGSNSQSGKSGSGSGSGGGHSSTVKSSSTPSNLPTADASDLNGGGSDSAPAPTAGGLSPDDSYHTDGALSLTVNGLTAAGGAMALGMAWLAL
ncbi:hypothetical protein K525DRAFT_258208 [Schizophyllum commune Loenen D]|nr:hypothetical protein K525DRAFT_258208 [Schizophyllum commune Loenen D]